MVLGATLLTGTAVASPTLEPAAPAARVDRGPGPGWQVGQGYERDDALLKAAAAVKQTGPVDPDPVEVEEARTRTTRTELDPVSGEFLTEVSGGSLNYQDTAGDWQPIVNDLEAVPAADGDGWVNGANRFTAQFPETLADGPVTLTDAQVDSRWVSLTLVGDPTIPAPAAPTPSSPGTAAARSLSALAAPVEGAVEGVVDGAEISYEDAITSGADVAYEAGADSVKETITLDSAAAAAAAGAVAFTLDAGTGLTPVERDDVITIQDSKGAAVFEIPAPFMDDAKGAHSDDVAVDLTATGDAWTVTLTPDATWLAAPERAYPVLVDPTIGYPTPMLGCSLRSSAATTSACSSAAIPVSWISTGAQERALLRFDGLFDAIPADAAITRGQLKLYVGSAATPASSVDVRELTQPFTNAATWNTRNGSTAWTTAGGDRASLVSARATLTPNGTYQNLEVGELVSRWVEGTSPYNGFSVEKTGANQSSELLSIGSPAGGNAPSLYVEWQYRTGDRKGNTSAINESLTDTTTLSVNPATGNAQISTNEFDIAGVGLDLQVSHTTNSLSTAFLSPLGYGWTTSNGGPGGASLDVQTYGVGYFDGAGTSWFFHKAIDGTYVRPMGLDVDLAASGSDFTVTDRGSKVVQRFTAIGGSTYGLKSITDRNANAITYNYDASATHPWSSTKILRSVTDTRGRTITITNPGYWNTAATDSANRSTAYTVTGNELKDYTDPAGGKYLYVYDAAHRVTQVTTPEGNVTKLTYDTTGRINKIIRVDNATAGTGPTWEFTYTAFDRTGGVPATSTSVKDPNGNTTTYTSDGRGRTGKVVDARGKQRTATYSPNDDNLTTTGATAGTAGAGSLSTSTNTYNTGSFTLATTRMPTGAGTANTYGTGTRLYDVTSSTDARGLSTTYTYNTAGETASVTRGGTTTRYLYQGDSDSLYGGTVNCGPTVNGTRTATKKGVLCEERDALWVAGSTANASAAHRTAYRYDTLGQLKTLIPAGTTEAGVKNAGRGIQTYSYDGLSRLTLVTDGNGKSTLYDYDAMDRQFYVQYNDQSTESTYYTGDGPLRSVAEYNAAGTQTRYTEYGRDPLQRLQYIDAPEGYTDLDYDNGSRLRALIDSAGTTLYGYNAANQLTSLAEPGGNCTNQTFTSPGAASTKCTLFNNDDDGRRIATRYPGGATQTWTLDDAGRTTRTVGTAGGSAKLDLAYTYTDATLASSASNPTKDTGLIQSITEATATKKTAYTYDGLDRLTVANTTATSNGAAVDYEAFCYDAAGNRTKYYTAAGANCSTASPANAYTYDAANQMSAATGTGLTGSGFSYDANGNQTNAKSAIGRSTNYSDRDAAINVTPNGGSAATSTYAGSGNADRLTAGSTSFQSTPLAPSPARSTTGSSSTWAVRDPQGAIIAIRQGATSTPASATSYYPFSDQVGSTRTLVAANGTVAATYAYSAYGVTKSSTGSLAQPFGYGRGITDSVTGLIKLGIRYYDAALGRFTQVDPTGQDFSYLYVAGNPVSLTDARGSAPDVGAAIGGVTGGIVAAGATAVFCAATVGIGCAIVAGAVAGAVFTGAGAYAGTRAAGGTDREARRNGLIGAGTGAAGVAGLAASNGGRAVGAAIRAGG